MFNTHTHTHTHVVVEASELRLFPSWSSDWFRRGAALGFCIASQSVGRTAAILPVSTFKKKKKNSHTSVSVDKWQAGGAVSKVNLRQTPSDITFPSQPCSLLSTQLRRCQHRDLASARTYSLSGVTRGQHSHFNWYYFHSSASSCVFDATPGWWCKWQSGERALSNPEVANNHNNLGVVRACVWARVFVCVCVCVWGDGLYVLLVIFSITRAVVKCSFSAVSPEQKNYWAPLGFTHSLTLISFLRSDESEGEAAPASLKRSGWSRVALRRHSGDC